MRRFAPLLLLLALASPAGAQQKRITIPTPTAAQAGLRGADTPAPTTDAEATNSKAAQVPTPQADTGPPAGLAFTRPLSPTSSAGPGGRTAGQCRTACAQSYYFCLADEDEQSCNPRWARCVAGCS
jgi:hypothetical protein